MDFDDYLYPSIPSHNLKVTGSNPVPATSRIKHLARLTRSGFLFSGFHVGGGVPWRLCLGVQPFRSSERLCEVARTAHPKGLGDHHDGLHYSGNVIPCSHGSRTFKVDRPRTNLGTRRGTAKTWPRTGIRAGMARRRRPLPRAPSHPSHFRRNSPDPVRQASQAENTRRIESRDQTARQTETCARLIRTY